MSTCFCQETTKENSTKMPSIQLSKIFSYVTFRNMRFLILDCPSNETLPYYLKEFVSHQITDVVRVCEPSYDIEPLTQNNINVHDWHYQDGSVPSAQIIQKWLNLVEEKFGPIHYKKIGNINEKYSDEGSKIAIHCVAGLGRAPVLVAIALIESGMESLDAVTYIRNSRRGAFNSKQIAFLDTYKRGQFNKKASKLANIMLSKREKNKNNSSTNNSLTFSLKGKNASSKSNTNSIISKNINGKSNEVTAKQPISSSSSTTTTTTNTTNRTSILFSFNKIFKSKNSANGNSTNHSHHSIDKSDLGCVKIVN